ncbi:uncharacterized protein LOC122856273 [Aphidius gifuensis]|uniref:uncharacterized protein LOC122856273 n=1 Tax=Aphidius gifuensis TaxID=684658 RepID=UPI001CDB8032|nr:uncharacterized protein LOC122856273 [Aphidius gifuensis]
MEDKKSNTIIDELSDHVRKHSKTDILNCLNKIKNDKKLIDNLIKNSNKLDILIKLLSFQNIKILDITLSILATLFLKSSVRENIDETKIAKNVVWIIKNLTSGMTLHCRACRLIGNIAESKRHAKALYKENVIDALNEDILNIIRISFQILYRLLQIAEFRPIIGGTNAIECLINILKKENNNESLLSSIHYEVISSICLLSREAVNRLKIRDFDGLRVMLKLLEEPDVDNKYHAIILHAFTQYLYDAESVSVMIKHGIVNVLANRLKIMALDVQLYDNNYINDDDDNNTTKKRTADEMTMTTTTTTDHNLSPSSSSSSSGEIIKFNKINKGRFSFDYCSNQWSPSSENSSSPSWPSNDNDNDICFNEDDNYSPVCSDNEETKSITTQDEEVDSLNNYITNKFENESNQIEYVANASHKWTLILFRSLTYWSDPIEGLADPTTIQALTAYISSTKNLTAPAMLNRIIQNHVYFLPLLLQGFVFDAQNLDHSQEYLRIFCNTAESGGAFGELATKLLRGTDIHKNMVAVSVPFVLKSKDKLRTLLNTYGGLDLIFKLLSNKQHELNKNSVLSICRLAETLEITASVGDNNSSSTDNTNGIININNYNKLSNDIVTFELDNGDTFDASRQLLCNKSEYFTAMLEGNFFEGGQKKVKLQNVTRGGLAALCLAMSGELFYKNNSIKYDNNDNDEDNDDKLAIESLLDAVLLADKYLMLDESEKLTEKSISILTRGNLIRAWNWSRINNCHELKVCCVKNFLVCELSREDRLRVFNDFLNDCNFQEFLNDIKLIITEQLLIR